MIAITTPTITALIIISSYSAKRSQKLPDVAEGLAAGSPALSMDRMKTLADTRPRDYALPEHAIHLVPDGLLYDSRRNAWIVTQRIVRHAPPPDEIHVITDPASSKIIELVAFVAPLALMIALCRLFFGGF
jgi:hypothetical protein